MSKSWQGFDGRIFLTPEEHATYRRRPPVRYSRRGMAPSNGICEVCHLPETPENQLQASHRIPFLAGVIKYQLTPEWLDGPANLTWAHRKLCNQAAEWGEPEILEFISALRS